MLPLFWAITTPACVALPCLGPEKHPMKQLVPQNALTSSCASPAPPRVSGPLAVQLLPGSTTTWPMELALTPTCALAVVSSVPTRLRFAWPLDVSRATNVSPLTRTSPMDRPSVTVPPSVGSTLSAPVV